MEIQVILLHIEVGRDSTGLRVQGLVEADLNQHLEQQIVGANTGSAANQGKTLITLFAKSGASQLFVEGFEQYLSQTASGCSGCTNHGTVQALFEVDNTADFTLKDGSIQGLTQVVNQNSASNNNLVSSQITVLGSTSANIGLDHQLSALNGNQQTNGGVSSLNAQYNAGTPNQNCVISTTGSFTQATACS